MDQLPEPIKSLLAASPWLLSAAWIVWKAWLKAEWDLLGRPGDGAFETRIQRLREYNLKAGYLNLLNRLLDWVNRFFGPEAPARPGGRADKLFGVQPFTPQAFGVAMLLAVIYPFWFLLIGWVVGNQGSLGAVVILPSIDHVWQRLLGAALLGGVIFCFWKAVQPEGKAYWFWLLIALAVA